MSLKSKFKTNAALVQGGKWFDVTTNTDGTLCRVRLRRQGRANKAWVLAFRENTDGVDTDNLDVAQDEAITVKSFVTGCVVDWENMQPEDDGKNVKFSSDAALALLSDPDWMDLLKDWQAKAIEIANFQTEKQEGEIKN